MDPGGGGLVDDRAYIEGSARLREAFGVLDGVAAEGAKAIVFLQSRKLQDALSDLVARRYRVEAPLIVRGDTPARRRQEFVDRFSEGEGFGVLILSPRAAGVGLNITAATHVIHLDRWWNPAVEDQCTARAYRIGQTRPVAVHYPMALHPGFGEGSYDALLDGVLERKRALSHEFFVPGELTADDFGDLGGGPKAGKPLDWDRTLREIDDRGAHHLEDWVRGTLAAEGFVAEGTPWTGDGGADVIVRDLTGRITHIVQCKHTGRPHSPVGASGGILTDLRRCRAGWNAPDAVFVAVTNAGAFSRDVRTALDGAGAVVVTRGELGRLVDILKT